MLPKKKFSFSIEAIMSHDGTAENYSQLSSSRCSSADITDVNSNLDQKQETRSLKELLFGDPKSQSGLRDSNHDHLINGLQINKRSGYEAVSPLRIPFENDSDIDSCHDDCDITSPDLIFLNTNQTDFKHLDNVQNIIPSEIINIHPESANSITFTPPQLSVFQQPFVMQLNNLNPSKLFLLNQASNLYEDKTLIDSAVWKQNYQLFTHTLQRQLNSLTIRNGLPCQSIKPLEVQFLKDKLLGTEHFTGTGFMPSYPYFCFRKPKRMRTAFSANQLMKLEEAFDGNQYLIGQERRDLASNLNLSETQVKVWFQNRRTKFKRSKVEDENGSNISNESNVHTIIQESDPYNEQRPNRNKEELNDDQFIIENNQLTKKFRNSHHVSRWRVETNQV